MKISRNKSMFLRGDDLFWFSLGDFNGRRDRLACRQEAEQEVQKGA